MAVKQYDELRLDVKAETADDGGVRQVDVRALRASGGEADDSCQDVPADLSQRLRALERGTAKEKEIIELGKTLFSILLPGKIGDFFDTIRTVVEREPEQGLRLRLHLPPSLHSIPWEYLYLQRGEGEKRPTDFLALDPRISIVRHPSTSVIADFDSTPRPRRILVVMAEPNSPSFVPLELHRDRKLVQEALSGIPGLEVEFLEKASFERFGDALGAGADIVHFAGHGDFARSGLGSSLYSAVGQGLLIFADNDNLPEPITSDQFAVRIQGRGVQLVVLGACQSGRTDELNVWSSVAASLMQIGMPAAIAMQYTIWNESALAFSRSFYRALAAGLPLDWAVSEGRHAVFDRCTRVKDDPNLGKYWRDWGVPVLYLRAGKEFVLPATAGKAPMPVRTEPKAAITVGSGDESTMLFGVRADIAEKLHQRMLTLFIGADLPESTTGLPSRRGLADRLAERFGLAQGQGLAAVAQQVMSHGNRWDFTDFLLQTLQPPALRPGLFYTAIGQFVQIDPPELIVTTAYHQLLELVLQQHSIPFSVAAEDAALQFAAPDRVTILKLFGDLQQVNSLVVTEQDHNGLLRGRQKPDIVDEVRRTMRRTCVLFLGYDLRDPAVTALFDEIAGTRFQIRSYAVWPGLTAQEAQSWAGNRGLTVLNVEPEVLLRSLSASR